MIKEADVLRAEKIVKVYRMDSLSFTALKGVSLKVKRGEFLCVLGPSGSGKSTLLHILGLLDTPTRGKLYIDGVDTQGLSEKEKADFRLHKIGFVFQSFNLIPSLTALENVEMPMIIDGWEKEKRKKRALELLKKLGLEDKKNNFPNQLSGGQKQRVAIARALAMDPAIILADEPTGNLDSKSGAEVLNIFSELHKEGRTLIIITHDESITKHAQRVVRIRDGLLFSDDKTKNKKDGDLYEK